MPPVKKTKSPMPILATKHKDKRANIPTEELRDFVADDEKAPKKFLYPRDPSLDPQLVWKGKDEQDRQPLEVPAVPIYIQEKIKPQAIIELVREGAKSGQPQQFDFAWGAAAQRRKGRTENKTMVRKMAAKKSSALIFLPPF